MPTDTVLDQGVTDELRWDPVIQGSDIGVSVLNGVVTLTGSVRSRVAKDSAGAAALRIRGVRAVANELVVRLPVAHERTDGQIAQVVVQTLKWGAEIPEDKLQIRVENGWVVMEGEVDWHHQRLMAEEAVQRLVGVKGISNQVRVKATQPPPGDLKKRIEEALTRVLGEAARSISVEVRGGNVILHGFVGTWHDSQLADRTVWKAPGVTQVDSRVIIGEAMMPDSASN